MRYRGGLALIWKMISFVGLLNVCSRCIDVEVMVDHFGFWRLTGFYCQSSTLLPNMADFSPWVCLGDFKDILHQYEKRGGRR